MNARFNFSTKADNRVYELWINGEIDSPDVELKENKYVIFFAHNVSIDERFTSKTYQEAFELLPDGDYHMMIEFKKPINGFKIRTYCSGSQWQISVRGE